MTWHSLPLFVRLRDRPVILLGEGEAADAKRRLLERAGALVVADHPDARLAIVAIEDEGAAVAAVAALRARGLLVNAVDRPHLCDFTLPAIVDRHPVLVAIGTGGVSAGLAAALRQRLEALLPAGLGRLADALFAARDRLRALLPDGGARRRAIAAGLTGPIDPLIDSSAERVAAWLGRLGDQDGDTDRHPGLVPGSTVPHDQRPVWLPSGGCRNESGMTEEGPFRRGGGRLAAMTLASPDPDDLTLRQARLLANADAVFHAPGVPAAILDRARADAARIVAAAPPMAEEGTLAVYVEMGG